MTFAANKNAPFLLSQTSQVQSCVLPSSSKIEVGNTLDKRIAGIIVGLKFLNDAAAFVSKKGTKALCAAVTLKAAFSELMKGDVFGASVLGVAGLKETYELLMKNGSLKEIQALLKENKAGLELTSEILGFNKLTLQQTAVGVESISKSLASLEQDLCKIGSLSDAGLSELRKEKQHVIGLYKQANKDYSLAQLAYKKSEKSGQEADEYFDKTLKGFNGIYQLAQKEGTELSDVIKIAEKMQKNCEKAKHKLQKCLSYQEQAKAYSDQANENYRLATMQAGQLIGKVENCLGNIQRLNGQAQGTVAEAQQQTEKLAEKVKQLKGNNDVLERVNERLIENNSRIIDDVDSYENYGMASIILGAIPAAMIGNAVGGPAVGLVSGVAGLKTLHNRNIIARKVGDWLFSIKTETAVIFAAAQKAAFKFDDNSSGFWGRYVNKTSSQTVGTIALQLGEKEIFEMRFNLKDKNIVKDADLNQLKNTLSLKLSSGEISKEECLKHIQSLEAMKIGSKPVISTANPYFYMLKTECSS